jgi:hypothetical protein
VRNSAMICRTMTSATSSRRKRSVVFMYSTLGCRVR